MKVSYKEQKAEASVFAKLFREDPEMVMALLDELVDLFIITDRAGLMLYVSKASFEITGYTQDELNELPVEVLIPLKKYPEMIDDGHKNLMLDVAAGKSEIVNHLRRIDIKHKDGNIVPTEVAVACLGDSTVPQEKPWFIASIRDRRLTDEMAKTINTLQQAIEIATDE